MKNVFVLLFVSALFLISWNTVKHGFGSIGGFTGSPSDGDDCTTCHPQNVQYKSNWIQPQAPNGFAAGDTISIYLYAEQDGMKNGGFELIAEDRMQNRIGTFLITDSVQTRVTNKGSATHTGNGHGTSFGYRTWLVDYKVPANAPDTIRFYAAFNLNNGHYGVDDTTYLSEYKIYNSTLTGISDTEKDRVVKHFPNPCSGVLNIEAEQNFKSLKIYDLTGKILFQTQNQQNLQIATDQFPQGTYMLHIQFDDQEVTEKFIKR